MAVKISSVILTLLSTAWTTHAANESFARYQVIIDKRPFGEEPPEAPLTKKISPKDSFAKNLRMSMLFEGARGIRVGLIDASQKNKSYILGVGESVNGIELIEADITASTALLKKGNEAVLFHLKDDPTPSAIPKKPKKATSRRSSYAERRRAQLARAAEKKAKEPAQPRLTGEALRKHLEEVQLDAIRTGKPPLPMALTPEMDQQLVEEGILAPQ